jgi:hypothetical protein
MLSLWERDFIAAVGYELRRLGMPHNPEHMAAWLMKNSAPRRGDPKEWAVRYAKHETHNQEVSLATVEPATAKISPFQKKLGLGPREQKLYEYLRSRATKKSDKGKNRDLWDVIQRVYGQVPRRQFGKYRVRLRQLTGRVNRKLKKAGNPRRIESPEPGYLTLRVPAPPKPAPTRGKSSGATRTPTGKSPRERCAHFIRSCLSIGINTSTELERLCCKEQRFSHRAYVEARSDLSLDAVRYWDGSKWCWKVALPVPPMSQPENRDTLQ